MMESPDEASEIACPIVLQAVCGDLQLLLSFPFTPLTYHVLLARAVEFRARNKATSGRLLNKGLCFMISLLSPVAGRARTVSDAGVCTQMEATVNLNEL